MHPFCSRFASSSSRCRELRTELVGMASRSSLSNWVLLCVVCILSSSISAMSEPFGMESGVKATGTRTRNVVEQAVIFQLKPNVSATVKEDMVQGFADLLLNCSEWVVAESAGLVVQPSQLEGESVGLFMRFFSKQDLDDFFTSEQKTSMAEKYILPYTTMDTITIHYEAAVDDTNEAVYRKGDAFKSGAERIVGIKVKNDTSQEDIDTMIKSLNDLNDAPELSSLLIQITAGANFCAFDQHFTHGLVVRCPSLEALHKYSKHPHHIGVISKTVWPIAENLMQADYIVDGSGDRRSFH